MTTKFVGSLMKPLLHQNRVHLRTEYADFSRTVAYSSAYNCVLTIIPM